MRTLILKSEPTLNIQFNNDIEIVSEPMPKKITEPYKRVDVRPYGKLNR